MIRTKPPSDAYRDAWDRVFADALADAAAELAPDHEPRVAAAPNVTINRWPTSHESDCPSRIGDPCRCPVGNL